MCDNPGNGFVFFLNKVKETYYAKNNKYERLRYKKSLLASKSLVILYFIVSSSHEKKLLSYVAPELVHFRVFYDSIISRRLFRKIKCGERHRPMYLYAFLLFYIVKWFYSPAEGL